MTIPNNPKFPPQESLPVIQTPEEFQGLVDSYSARTRRNSGFSNYTSLEEIRDMQPKLLMRAAEFYTPSIYLEKEDDIFLASVSKIAIAQLASELFANEQTIELPKDIVQRILNEINERNEAHISSNKSGDSPISVASRLTTIGPLLQGGVYDENTISINDLIELTLILSTNSTTTILKELCMEALSSEGSLEEKRNNLYREMKSRLPGFNITTDTNNNYIWVQGNANTGKLSEFVNLQASISRSNPDLAFKMSNNPIDFKFDFTHSELGQMLIAKGAQIIEKTGSYEVGVNWCRNLLDQGLPFHAPLLTVVTILKDGKEFSFGYYRAYELPFPDEALEPYTEEMQFDSNTSTVSFPNVYSEEFLNHYVPKFEEIAYPDFRANMLHQVAPFIEDVFGIRL